MTTELFFLIKIGSEEHMTRLIGRGEVYLNTVESMRAYDATTGRGDPAEGRAYITNYPTGTLEFGFIKGRQFRYERLWVSHTPNLPMGNVYCLYSFGRHHTVGLSEFTLDPRCAMLGSHFVIIKDLPEFFERMERTLVRTGLKYRHGLVRYYDEWSYTGPLSVFQKPKGFAYQQELRFHVANERGEAMVLQLGRLTDIAEIHPTAALEHLKAYPQGHRHVSKGFGRARP